MKIITIPVGHMGNNCYIVYDESSHKAVAIDAPTDAEMILNTLCDNKLICTHILLTHSHYDHIGALDEIKSATNAKICIHESEARALNNPSANLAQYSGTHSPTSPADITLKDGDTIVIGDVNILVLHTPGHTIGGVCFYCTDRSSESDSALFSGDTLFLKDIGRCDLPGGDYAVIKQSIRNKLYTLPSETIVYPGHGGSSTLAYEKQHNNYIRQDLEYEY